jgi:hypothetical protein
MAMTNSDIATGAKMALPRYKAAATRIAAQSMDKIRNELSPAIGRSGWSDDERCALDYIDNSIPVSSP